MATNGYNLGKGAQPSGGTTFGISSFTPTADRLALLWVGHKRVSGSIGTPTFTGGTNTWTQIATRANGTNTRRITLFRSLSATPVEETGLTIGFAGQTQDSTEYMIQEFDEVVTTGTNGADAIVQSATASGSTSIAITLSAFEDAVNNVSYLAVTVSAGGLSITVTGYTELDTNVGSGANPEGETDMFTGEDLSVAASSSGSTIVGIAVEIKSTAPVASGAPPRPSVLGQAVSRSATW